MTRQDVSRALSSRDWLTVREIAGRLRADRPVYRTQINSLLLRLLRDGVVERRMRARRDGGRGHGPLEYKAAQGKQTAR